MNFKQFSDIIRTNFDNLAANHDLYRVNLDKHQLYDTYLQSFPDGTNPIYIERTSHDCQHCRNFIRDVGNVVAIIDGHLVSIWRLLFNPEGADTYESVSVLMQQLVESSTISNVFLNQESVVSKPTNVQLLTDQTTKTWNHLSCVVPAKFVERDIATQLSKTQASHQVFNRALTEISVETVDDVLDLMEPDEEGHVNLYRGAEYRTVLANFRSLLVGYNELIPEHSALTTPLPVQANYAWANFRKNGARIRNTVIGTLLTDVQDGMDLTEAANAFGKKMDPTNFKQVKTVATKGMITQAMKTITELDIEPSLQRRHAHSSDISINNVLYADRSTSMSDRSGLEAMLLGSIADTKPSAGIDISIDDFMSSVVPNVTSIEAFVANNLTGNLASIIAPADASAPNILAWDNNFSWSYNGGVTDSMKERVKSAGGKVDGVLRFSIQWNEERNDRGNDLDAHCHGPKGHIYFSKRNTSDGGNLDIDITSPSNSTAVENITWPSLSRMSDGDYTFSVHNFSGSNTDGFRAQIEMNGELHEFDYKQSVKGQPGVAIVTLKNGAFSIKTALPSTTSSREVWNVATEQWHKVTTIMHSPNHWDGQSSGNKHTFFTIADCSNPEPSTGIYNEFLSPKLRDHRKVFQLLSRKLRVEPSADSLAGLGFSSTVRNTLTVRTQGSQSKVYNIKF